MKYHAHCRIILLSNKEKKEREREKAGRKQNHITINCVLNEEWKPSAFLFGCQTEESYNVTVNPFNYYTTRRQQRKGETRENGNSFLFLPASQHVETGSGKSANLKITICCIVFFLFRISSFHSSGIGYVLRPYCIPCLFVWFFIPSLYLFVSFSMHMMFFLVLHAKEAKKKRIASGIRATIVQPPWVAHRRQPATRHRY